MAVFRRLVSKNYASLSAFAINLRDMLHVAVVIAEGCQSQCSKHVLSTRQQRRLFGSGRNISPADTSLAALAARLQIQGDEARSAGKTKRAIRLYSQAILITPYNAALFLLRGQAFLDANRPRDAAQDFVSGIQLDPGNETLIFLMHTANALAAQGSAAPTTWLPAVTIAWRWQK